MVIRIVYVGSGRYNIPPSGYGAVEKHIWNISEAMRRRGHTVHIINKVSANGSIGEYKFALLSINKLKKIDYDVLHLHTAPVGLVYSLFGYRFIYTSHSRHWINRKSLREYYGYMVEKHNTRYATHVIALTEDIKRITGRSAGISVIPNGVDTELYRPSIDSINKVNKIVMMGEVSPRKDFHLGLLALNDMNVMVEIIGPVSNNSYAQTLKKIYPGVVLLGELPEKEVARRLASSTVFIHPSRSEGMSMAVIEAMSSGLPVIASTASKSVMNENSGFLFDMHMDDKDIVRFIREKVNLLLSSMDLVKRMGAAGRSIVAGQYDWNIIAERIEKIYSNFLTR